MTIQIAFAFAFGVIFLITLLVLAVAFPNPTPFQYTVFRIVLALAAAGVAAMIPGFINVKLESNIGLLLRAGGALAVFVIVFFFNPARLAVSPDSTDDENDQTNRGQTQTGGDNSSNMQAGRDLNIKS